MKISFEQITKNFISDVKQYLEKSTFEPMVLKAVYKAIDSHEAEIKDSVQKYFSLAGIEDGMTITLPSATGNTENTEDT
jgi:hypothetical protein